ncbi:Rib/alpha-like domain-containing protein [Lactobacillus sp. ESL0791]|uniref:Rib/alpha-like domain-containing protein n=1 Tax=Lactobacillus sp. ESL0791 TaxID=2983234 RepID=UPI0023F8D093|nr:Rib/alpha-like domain-containing protein [Lactobacillus sp. ESL0791]MDF7639690.1 Rib/alpha-like domain-containing protein [Lactobacillus sp. ESL0791]
MLGRNNYNERLRRLEGQNKKERFSIRKLAVGAASVLLGFSFVGLNGQKAQAETTDAGTDEAKTAQAAQTAADKKDTSTDQGAQAKQQKTVKPQLSTFSGLTMFLRSGEETASSEGSTSSAGTESSSSSSSSDSTPSSAADTGQQEHGETAPSAASSGQDEQQAANSDPKPDEDINKDDEEQQKAKQKPVVGPQDAASAAAALQTSINNANDWKGQNVYRLVAAATKADFETSLTTAQNLLDTYNANNAAVTEEQLTAAKTDLDAKNSAAHKVEVRTWNDFTTALSNSKVSIVSLQEDLTSLSDINLGNNRQVVIEGNGHLLSVRQLAAYHSYYGKSSITLKNLLLTGTDKTRPTICTNKIILEDVTGTNASFQAYYSSYHGALDIELKGRDIFTNDKDNSIYLFYEGDTTHHLTIDDGAEVVVNTTGMSIGNDPNSDHYNGIDVGKNASITYNMTKGNITQGNSGVYFKVAEGGSLKINLHGNTGTHINTLKSLVASQPKAISFTSDNDRDTFSFGVLDIDGHKLGLSDGTYKWMFNRAGDGSSSPLHLLGDKINFDLELLDNNTPYSQIPSKGKASSNYTSIDGSVSDKDTLAAVMDTANQNKNGTGIPSFSLGSDLYGAEMSKAGMLDLSAADIVAHKDQTELGSAAKYLKAWNSRDEVPESISNLQNNHTVTDISWLKNKAMDKSGNLTDDGIIKGVASGALNDSIVGPTSNQLGNAVIRVIYDDGTYDDVPIKVGVIEARPKSNYRATTGSGVVPTEEQAKDAISFFDSDNKDAAETAAANWKLHYEWVRRDPDEHGDYQPLTSDDVQASGSHNVAIMVHYVNNEGHDTGRQLVKVSLIVNPYSMNGSTITFNQAKTVTAHLREPDTVDDFVINTPTEFTSPSEIDNLVTITHSGAPITPSTVVKQIEWFKVPTAIGDAQDAQIKLHYKDDSISDPVAIKVNVIGGISSGTDTTLDRGNAGYLTAETAKAALTPASVAKIEAVYPGAISYSWAANSDGMGVIDSTLVDSIGEHHAAYVVINYGDHTKQIVKVYLHVRGNAEKYQGNITIAQINSHVNASQAELNASLNAAVSIGSLISSGPTPDYTVQWSNYPDVNQNGLIDGIMKQTGKAKITFSDDSIAEEDVEINVVGGQSNDKDTVINRGAALTAVQAKAALTQASVDRINQYYPSNVTYSWAGNAAGSGAPDVNSSDMVGQHHTAYVVINFGNGRQQQVVAVNLHVRGAAEQAQAEGKIHFGAVTSHVNASANLLDDQLASATTIDDFSAGDYTVSWKTRPDVTIADLSGGKKTVTGKATIFFNTDNSQVTQDVTITVVGGEAIQQVLPINLGTTPAATFTPETAKTALTNTSVANITAAYPSATYSWSKDGIGSDLPDISTADGQDHVAYVVINYGDSNKQAVPVTYRVKNYQEQFAGKITVPNHFKMHASDDAPQAPANIKDFTAADRIKTLINIQGVADSSQVVKKIIWANPANTPISTSVHSGQTQSGKIKLVYQDDSESEAITVNVDIVGAKLKENRTFFKGAIPKAKDMVDNPNDLQEFGVTDNDYSWVDKTSHNLLQDADFTPGVHDIALRVGYSDGTKQYVELTVTVSTMKDQYKDQTTISNISTHVGANINRVLKDATRVVGLEYGTGYTVSWQSAPDITETGLINGAKPTANCTAKVTYSDGTTSDLISFTVDVVGGQANMEGTVVNLGEAPTADDAALALTDQSKSKISTLVAPNAYTWAKNVDGSGPVDVNHFGDNNSAYVVIHYLDGTIQTVKVKLHVKSMSEQYANKVTVTPIDTHVGVNPTQVLKNAISVTGLTYGTDRDYTVIWKPSDTPDFGAYYLANGTKSISGTAIINYHDGSSSAEQTVSGTVVGGQPLPAGITVDVNAALTSDDAKAALTPESVAAIGLKATSYSWCAAANGTGSVDTSTPGANNSAYVLIEYTDGIKQAVKVNLYIKSMSEQYTDKISVAPINTHVGADMNGLLVDKVTVTGLADNKYTVSWQTPPDINDTGLSLAGKKDVTGTVLITFSDHTTATKTVNVNVIGGKARDTKTTVSLNSAPGEDEAKAALTGESLVTISSEVTAYSWVRNSDGTGNVDTSHPGDNDSAYVVIKYKDHTQQVVKVKLHVRGMSDQYGSAITAAAINTHVGVAVNGLLTGKVTVAGLADDKYSVSWQTLPDVTGTGLSTSGFKTVTGTALITFTDDGTTATKTVNVNVIGGYAATEGIAVDLNASLSEGDAKAALTNTSVDKIKDLVTSYAWAKNSDGTGSIDTSHPGDNDSAYVVIKYNDETKQAVKVKLHVRSLADQFAGKVNIAGPLATHVNANAAALLTGKVTVADFPQSGATYSASWQTGPDLSDTDLGIDGKKTAVGKVLVSFSDGSSITTDNVEVKVVGAKASQEGTSINLNDNLTAETAKQALTDGSKENIAALANSYTWAKNSDGSGTVDTGTAVDRGSAYVIVGYTDGTKQAVKVVLTIKGLSDQYANKINVKPITTHVNAQADSLLLGDVVTVDDLDASKYTVSWQSKPDLSKNDLGTGTKTVSGTVLLMFNDHTTATKEVTVKVVGAVANSSGATVTVGTDLAAPSVNAANKAQTALLDDSLTAINSFVSSAIDNYTWCKNEDGSGTVTTSAATTDSSVYVKVKYTDGTSQTVAVKLTVTGLSDKYGGSIVANTINTHVGANIDRALSGQVTVTGLEPNKYEVSWKTSPDISATGLEAGRKQVTGQAQVKFSDNSVAYVDVPINVIGGQGVSGGVTTTAGMSLGAATTGLTLPSYNVINASVTDYAWAATPTGSGAPDVTTLGTRTIYVMVNYKDGTKQAVAVDLTVEPASAPVIVHKVKQKAHIKMHAVTGTYADQGELGNPASFLADETDYEGSVTKISGGATWKIRPLLTQANTTQSGTITVKFSDGAADQDLEVAVDVIGGVATGNATAYTIDGPALTESAAKAALTPASRDAIAAAYSSASYRWAKNPDGSDTPDLTATSAFTAYVVIDYGDTGIQAIPVLLQPERMADKYNGKISALSPITLHVKGQGTVISTFDFTDKAGIDRMVRITGVAKPSDKIKSLRWDTPPSAPKITNGLVGNYLDGKIVAVYEDDSESTMLPVKVNLVGGVMKGEGDNQDLITVNQNAALPLAFDQLTAASTNAIFSTYTTATYSWCKNADGTGNVPDTDHADNIGDTTPIYLKIKYGTDDNDVQIIRFRLHVKGEAEQNSDRIYVDPIVTHVNADINAALAAAVHAPGMTGYSASWSGTGPNVTANGLDDTGEKSNNFDINVVFTSPALTVTRNVNVRVIGAQSKGTALGVKRGGQLNRSKVSEVLTYGSYSKLNGLVSYGYPVSYRWAANATDNGSATLAVPENSEAYLIVDYGDQTKQVIRVDLNVQNQAQENEGKVTSSAIETHVGARATDLDRKLKDAVTIGSIGAYLVNGVDYTLSWVTQPDLTAAGLNSTGLNAKDYQVKISYTDGSIAYTNVRLKVYGAVATGNTTNVDQGNPAGFTQGKITDAVTIPSAISGQVVDTTWSKDGSSNDLPNIAVGDENANDTRPAYVVVHYNDGTMQAVRVKLHVNKLGGSTGDIQINDMTTHVGAESMLDELLQDNVTVSSGGNFTTQWLTPPDVSSTGLINGRKQALGQAKITVGGLSTVRPVVINVVGVKPSGSSVKVNQGRPLAPDTVIDSSVDPAVLSCLDLGLVQNYGPFVYQWSGTNSTNADGYVNIAVTYRDGGTQIVSVPLQVIIPVGGTINTYQGASLSSADAQRAISNYSELIKVIGCTWGNPPDTSTPGIHSETVRLTYGDGTSEKNVPVSINVTSKPSSSSMADKNPAIGGSISVPQYTDLASDTSYAARGISNSSSLPAGTTYRWDTSSLPNTSAPVGSKFNGFVNVSYPDGSAASVGVGVTIVAPINNNVVIGHDTPVYDPSGKTDGTIIASGSVVPTQGSKVINGENTVNISHSNDYIPSSNVTGTKVKLIHNAYIYKRNGKLKDKHVLPRGMEVTVYGEPVTIRGKQYFQVGKNQYIKKNNFPPTGEWKTPLPAQNEPETIPAVEKTLMHDSYRYDGTGSQLDQVLLRAGSQIKTYGKATINKESYYVVDDNVYLPAENIDAQKRKLKRNACVYDQDGDRLKKKLKKGKKVKTYGDTVMINDKEYYIVGNKQYVRKGNFGRKK